MLWREQFDIHTALQTIEKKIIRPWGENWCRFLAFPMNRSTAQHVSSLRQFSDNSITGCRLGVPDTQ
jgi:hypothetical protein